MPLLCPVISVPDLADVVPAVHAAHQQAAVFDRVLPDFSAGVDLSAPVHHPVVVAAYAVRPVLPVEAELHEEHQAVLGFRSEVFLPAFPVVREQTDCFLPVA